MKSVMLGECGNRGRSGGWYCHSEGEKTHKYKWKNDEAIGRGQSEKDDLEGEGRSLINK